jgi:hypothetical protein
VPVRLDGTPSGSVLVDLLDDLSEHELDAKSSVDIGLEPYGYRWLRLRSPDDQPII